MPALVQRRSFLTLLGGAAATGAYPDPGGAQQRTMPVLGYLDVASADGRALFVAALREGLKEAGFIEGQNLAIEHRFADNHADRLPALAAELVGRQVTAIAAGGNAAARAAKMATATIPIVFVVGDDPVASGLVASLSRPGGNVTGVTPLNLELVPKRIELLHELLPRATVVALLMNPTNSNAESISRDSLAAARTLGLQIHLLRASTERDLEAAFNAAIKLQAAGLVVGSDVFFNSMIEQIAMLSVRHGVPAIFQTREFAAAGGLASYGSNTAAFRSAGVYAGRVLKGEKPSDLPVQQPTKVELVLNLKTAKALGINVPLALLGRADEVIE
jgi:putative ABC transport system substrate-binding protein